MNLFLLTTLQTLDNALFMDRIQQNLGVLLMTSDKLISLSALTTYKCLYINVISVVSLVDYSHNLMCFSHERYIKICLCKMSA